MNGFKRWPEKPNEWPAGIRVSKRKDGFWGWLLNQRISGVAGDYQYASASTMIPIHWDDGSTTMHHISEFP
jgi:hypothetical protein